MLRALTSSSVERVSRIVIASRPNLPLRIISTVLDQFWHHEVNNLAVTNNLVSVAALKNAPKRGSREIVVESASNEFVFAVVGHVGCLSPKADTTIQPKRRPQAANPFTIRTSAKRTHNSFRIRTSKFTRLKVLWNPHLQKRWGEEGKLLTSSLLPLLQDTHLRRQALVVRTRTLRQLRGSAGKLHGIPIRAAQLGKSPRPR